jgi:cysteine synthase A
VVLFVLEWCEFCWSERKLLQALNIAYLSVDLDSVQYQSNGLSAKIRQALREKIGSPTIPQTFIAGELVGDCTAVLSANDNGSLQTLLDSHKIAYDHDKKVTAVDFLPSWVEKR